MTTRHKYTSPDAVRLSAWRRAGLVSQQDVVIEYGISKTRLRELEVRGLLHPHAPFFQSRPLLYSRDELDALLLGGAR